MKSVYEASVAHFQRTASEARTKAVLPYVYGIAIGVILALIGSPKESMAQLEPEWISRIPVGTSLSSGTAGVYVEPNGVSYITGISGSSSNTDITTVSFAADGSTRWSKTWGSPNSGSDQASGLTLGSGGILYVVGNTPGPNFFANILVLAYDAATGNLLKNIRYSSGPGISEAGASIVTDAAGNIYLTGTTVGDGPDVITLKLDPAGHVLWRRVWDGPAFAPFSSDTPVKILLDPNGDVVVLVTGTMGSNHPDYVVLKYDPDDGSTMWEANWGVTGGDFPSDMEIDAAGDIYVTGIGIDFIDKFSTIKLRGSDGQLLWQFYDEHGLDHRNPVKLYLDGVGGVFITGTSDPDGDQSNFNDDFYTVKRNATTGAQIWNHAYGDPCVHPGCYDVPSDIRVDAAGNVFVIGVTSSPPYSNDLILLVLDTATGNEINRGLVFNTGSEILHGGALRFDSAFNLYDGGYIYNADTGAISMTVSKWTSLVGGGNPITLQARVKAQGNKHQVQLQWTPADGGQVHILRNGVIRGTTADNGKATDKLGTQTGTFTYQVCETDSGDCSNELSVEVQ